MGRCTVLSIGLSVLLISCGTFHQSGYEWAAWGEAKTEKQGYLQIEVVQPTEYPEEVHANVKSIDAESGDEESTTVVVVPTEQRDGAVFFDVALTNTTDRVVRLHDMEVRLFDPNDNEWEAMNRAELQQYLEVRFGEEATQIAPQLRQVKFLGKSSVVLPERTTNEFLIFRVGQVDLSGVWRLVFHEMPIAEDKTNDATTIFEFEYERQGFRETYSRNFFSTKMVSRERM